MRALYLYFVDTATQGRGPSSTPGEVRPVFDEPLTPIVPGAFSRWMASRERDALARVATDPDADTPAAPRPSAPAAPRPALESVVSAR